MVVFDPNPKLDVQQPLYRLVIRGFWFLDYVKIKTLEFQIRTKCSSEFIPTNSYRSGGLYNCKVCVLSAIPLGIRRYRTAS